MAAEVTGAHVVVQNLIAQGVRRVFVIPGGQGWGLEAGWEGAGWGARSRPLTTPVEAGPCPSCDRVRLISGQHSCGQC